jgi:hypothetical protein
LEVTTSFVKLIRGPPAEGYVRSNEAVEYRRYAELLEENNALKEQLIAAEQSLDTTAFKGHDRLFKLRVRKGAYQNGRTERTEHDIERSRREIISAVAEATLQTDDEPTVLELASASLLENRSPMKDESYQFEDRSALLIRRQLTLFGLIEIAREIVSVWDFSKNANRANTVRVWRLTDYGRRQLRGMSGE